MGDGGEREEKRKQKTDIETEMHTGRNRERG